jgi:hypothetical protein
MSARIALSRDGREFEPCHWYHPKKTGPATKARYLLSVERDGVNADWVRYRLLMSDGGLALRNCTVAAWCAWAGERVVAPEPLRSQAPAVRARRQP